MDLLACKGLSFAYDGIPVVQGINFRVTQGDYLCIVGENGSGKSTLLKGLLNLKKPSAGSITMDESLSVKEIGYLPQQTVVQKDFPAGVMEVVLSGCLNRLGFRPFYSKREKALAEDNLQKLGIAHLRNHCYRELSGGQQQRVLLARALCATQRLLLLDEPAAGLDPVVTKELYGLIAKINQELGITVMMVSHDIAAAANHARHILHLRREQLFFGTARAYRSSELGSSYIGGAAHG